MFPILTTGDLIEFVMVGTHIIPMLLAPWPLLGSSDVIKDAGPRCVFGDELPLELQIPMPYIDGAYVTPGLGMINLEVPITSMSLIQFDNGMPVLLSGVPFPAEFNVSVPAIQPSVPPVPDANLTKELLVTYTALLPYMLSE
jgi:hypothetical protein